MLLRTADILAALPYAVPAGPREDRAFRGVCTDTRGECRGALFIALAGERFDASLLLDKAVAAGAAGAVIGPAAEGRTLPEGLPCFRVPDTLRALQDLAGHVRRGLTGLRTVAITGSNGKTTTKEMIAAVLRTRLRVSATAGNLNNHIGVPLTLLALEPEDQVLVTEIGASHAGEVRRLAGLALPALSVITNIAPAHLEGFGSVEGVLRAKLELFEETLPGGTRCYNGDDQRLARVVPSEFPGAVSFGLGEGCRERATEVRLDERGCAEFILNGGTRVRLPLPGRHNVHNALAAAAVGRALGLEEREIAAGLETVRVPGMRMELRPAGDVTLLNDCYNANPLSMREALSTLQAIAHQGPRLAVLGEMRELGAEAGPLHRELAGEAARRDLALVAFVGEFAAAQRESFLAAGGDPARVLAAPGPLEAWEQLAGRLRGGELLLVKGSRGIRLERLIEQLDRARGTA